MTEQRRSACQETRRTNHAGLHAAVEHDATALDDRRRLHSSSADRPSTRRPPCAASSRHAVSITTAVYRPDTLLKLFFPSIHARSRPARPASSPPPGPAASALACCSSAPATLNLLISLPPQTSSSSPLFFFFSAPFFLSARLRLVSVSPVTTSLSLSSPGNSCQIRSLPVCLYRSLDPADPRPPSTGQPIHHDSAATTTRPSNVLRSFL